MSIDFRLRDFFYPVRILRFRRFLETSQWADEENHRQYQRKRLQRVLRHAYEQVPYYRALLDRLRLRPEDIDGPEALGAIPMLSRADLRRYGKQLVAANLWRHRPVVHRTTGTTGEPVEFYLDKHANALEFCYYWRYWSWGGYRLGRPFAELGVQAFLGTDPRASTRYTPWLRKLDLNASRLSRATIRVFVSALEKRRVAFLKGPPSGLHVFALLLRQEGLGVELEAVFTTGETLLPHQRRVLDSYGHMERTVGIAQCPEGGYHINPEYGLLEVEKIDHLSTDAVTVGTIVGTSLHNLAMPLIRYRTGDLIEIRPGRPRCRCGRSLPLCERILGRTQDVLVTRDGRYVTNAFVVFHAVQGVTWFQIVQHELDRLEVRVATEETFTAEEEEKVKANLGQLVGPARIEVRRTAAGDRDPATGPKYRSVVSLVDKDGLG
jgi:phenylacetate-CoA ligase